MTLIATPGEVVVRRASSADNAGRCELFARVAMESDLVLSVRREPDFDALYRLQADDWECTVVEVNSAIEGMGTILVRDGYVGGRRVRVGYLGDLRFSAAAEGRFLLDRFYAPLLEEAAARWQCDYFLTAVIASNARALRALTVRTARARARGRPLYTPLMDFDIRSLHLLAPPSLVRRRETTGVHVRRATGDDLSAITRLLDDDGRRRPFGYAFGANELERRLATWPGLTIDSFYIAEGARGMMGCMALWDAAPVKRMIVGAYLGAMSRTRFWYDVAARVLGMPTLPTVGEPFRYLYVTHPAIRDDDPAVLRALLDRAYADVRTARRGYHFLSACVPAASANDPLSSAFNGFAATNLPARLFVVTLPGREVPRGLLGVRPGFEMALV